MTLPRENRRHLAAPGLLDRCKNSEFVIHQHIVISWISTLHILERFLLVNIDQHVPFDGFKNTGALNLARLKYHVAVGQNDRPAPLPESFQHVERSGIKAVGERVIDEEVGRRDQMRFVRVFDSEALQSAEVIAITKLVEEFLLNRPELVTASGSEFTLDMRFEVGLKMVGFEVSPVTESSSM